MENSINTPDFFKRFGYSHFNNILSIEECNKYANILLDLKTKNSLAFEGKTENSPRSFYDNSFGLGGIEIMEDAMRTVQSRVENQIGVKITHANSFGRIYYNGGSLNKHVDRKGLDYTMSITLRSNIEKEWPLYWKDLQGNIVNMEINQGDGALILGTTMTHWREPLVCRDDQYFIALFMHWSFVK